MTRTEKINQAKELEQEIESIKDFLKVLKAEATTPKHMMLASSFIRKTTNISLLGVFKHGSRVEVKIPDKLVSEISAKCQLWINELESRADRLVVGD